MSAFCSIHHRDLVHILLDSHLSIEFSLKQLKWCHIFYFGFYLSVCTNAIDFGVLLILYPVIVQHSFILFYRFFGIFYIDKHPVFADSFISSFPICMPSISFSCHIAVVRTSSTTLNKSGDS